MFMGIKENLKGCSYCEIWIFFKCFDFNRLLDRRIGGNDYGIVLKLWV